MEKVSYPACEHTKRNKPNMDVNKEVAEEIGMNFRTLPMYEKGLFDYKYRKHYSLENNEFLKCRWREYVKNFDTRVFAPFQFVDVRDYHFYNCRNRLLPAVSFHKQTDFRFKLKEGPGVDFVGQMPIPIELQMKRGVQKVVRPKKLVRTSKDPNFPKRLEAENVYTG